MPFTLSHIAAVVPFMKTSLSKTALIVGALAPDISYFIPFVNIDRLPLHSFYNFHYLLGGSLLGYVIFKSFFLPGFLSAIPMWLQVRLPVSDIKWSLKNIILILIALSIGLLSHLIWDGFTHNDSEIFHWIPQLNLVVEKNQWGTMRVFHYLQFYSSVVGLILVIFVFYRLFKSGTSRIQNVVYQSRSLIEVWSMALLMTLAYVGIGIYFDLNNVGNKHLYIQVIIYSMSGLGLFLCSYGAYVNRDKPKA